MLHNHLASAIRHIKNNKGFVLINILGLSIGMTVCLLIMLYVSYENNYDCFHEDYENIYRFQYNIYKNGELKMECAAAVPAVGPAMKNNFPEVIDFCRAFPIMGKTVTIFNRDFEITGISLKTAHWNPAEILKYE